MAYYMEEITPTSRFLRAAKAKGYQALLSPTTPTATGKSSLNALTFFRLFDGGVVSYQVHQVKPDAEIYQTLLGKYGLAPENTPVYRRPGKQHSCGGETGHPYSLAEAGYRSVCRGGGAGLWRMKTDTLIFDIGSVLVYLDFP